VADIAIPGAGQAQEVTGATRIQPFATQFGPPPVLVLDEGPGEDLAQLAVTLAVPADQQHPGRLVALDLVGDPAVGADDRLDALAAGTLVKLDHPEQVGEIGDAKGRHAVSSGAGNGRIHLHDPVGDRVLGMETQVDVAGGVGFGHPGILPASPHRFHPSTEISPAAGPSRLTSNWSMR
jgi:hypothetical protein